jgi:hypothetical protein
MYIYTGCPRRNVPDCGSVFLMLKYTDITQKTYVQSWTVTEIMAREKCGLLSGPLTVPVSWVLSMSVLECGIKWRYKSHASPLTAFLQIDNFVHVAATLCVMCRAWNTKDNYDMSASVFVVQFNGFMSLTI